MAAFAGLDPLEKSSAGKVKFGGISKQGNWLLRFLLEQAAHLTARHDGRFKSFYKKLAKKKANPYIKGYQADLKPAWVMPAEMNE